MIKKNKDLSVFKSLFVNVLQSWLCPLLQARQLQNSLSLIIIIFIMSTIVVTILSPLTCLAADAETEIENLSQLPEGQTLLLRPRVKNIFYEDYLYAVRKNNTLYYALGDFIDVFNFPINYDENTGSGAGWFLREDWYAEFDLENNKISVQNQEISLSNDDLVFEDNIFFIKQNKIEEIFNLKLTPDIAQQYIEIDSSYPLPKVAVLNRHKKRTGSGGILTKAELPRQKVEDKWLDLNTADIRLGSRIKKTKSNRSLKNHTAVIAAEGQALKHNAYGLVTYDNQNKISTAVARLSKRSEEANLLGPLKARSYAIGDTTLADVPLTGDARQEVGFRLSNNKLENTQYETTDITGSALPGWDIELYRNGILLANINVDQTGQYEFANIQLFGGDNNLELFFYGPQGEIRRKEINIPITAAVLASQDGVYDVSLSLSETQTYQKYKSDNPDKGKPHLAARYNKTIGNALTYVGLRHRDIGGESKTFLGVGATALTGQTIIDVNLAADEKGAMAARLAGRRQISGWDLVTLGQIQSNDYAANGEEKTQTLKLSTSANRNFQPTQTSRVSIFSRGEFSQNEDNQSLISRQLGGSFQKGPINISNSLRYDTVSGSSTAEKDRLDNALSIRANLGKVYVRGGLNYDILPQKQIDQYFTQVSYRPNNKFSGDVLVNHYPVRDYSEARLNLNYTNNYFRTSPYIEIDSNQDVNAGVNFNFSLVDDPNKTLPIMTSNRIIGRGLVSSFVYHDKNGNNIFDAHDEPLPDVIVESVNVRRRVETNDNGYSLINDLPTTRATDIRLDEETLPDSFMVSGFRGVSVLPNAGEITELQFPVHMSGEIDGTISMQNKKGEILPVKNAEVNLYLLNKGEKKVITTQTATDGFYVASKIPPGKYLMAVSDKTARKYKVAASQPKIIDIGYEGDVLYGENIDLEKNKINVPIEVSYLSEGDDVSSQDIIYTIKTAPDKRSKLLTLLGRMQKNNAPEKILSGLQEASLNGVASDDYKRFTTPSNDLKTSYEKCRELAESAVPCTLEVFVPAS